MNNCLEHTHQIFFEISNMCNKHCVKCPRNFSERKNNNRFGMLSTEVFCKTIDELKEHNYIGDIGFSLYSEPIMDPRLFSLIKYTKDTLDNNCRTHIVSNGHYIDQQMLDELTLIGVDILWISAYTQKEIDRCNALKSNISEFRVLNRLTEPQRNIYNSYTREIISCSEPCYAPLNLLSIDYNGNVLLCCLDYESRHIFGNIYDESLIDIIQKDEVQELYKQLTQGERHLDMCLRCGTHIHIPKYYIK